MKTACRTLTRIVGVRTRHPLLGWVALATTLAGCGGSSAGGGAGAGGQAGKAGAGGAGGASEATGGTSGVDLDNWAEWPMPNGPADVAAGAPNPESYTANGDGTVTDNVTGLMWQQTVPLGATQISLGDATLSYCPSLRLGGHTDCDCLRR